MTPLIININNLLDNDKISTRINQKISSFNKIKKASNETLFSELCYCILTANCQAQTCMTIQNTFPYDFSKATKKQIKQHLKTHHYRFPNIRTQYILEAQTHKNKLQYILNNQSRVKRRNWFVNNIKGFGMKEASHYLRNIGYQNYAIIDTHILSLLQNYQIIKKPKTITKNKYLQIEQKLKKIAEQTELTLAHLDLYLWYLETGLILK
ncbi:MAG: N-glycosylase/DNA lyase [Candidatus Thermoplasmatota archaeon]|nr:N-glycosylase/DNA lyase [Candidatus Thermoplasmatota archaeon]